MFCCIFGGNIPLDSLHESPSYCICGQEANLFVSVSLIFEDQSLCFLFSLTGSRKLSLIKGVCQYPLALTSSLI